MMIKFAKVMFPHGVGDVRVVPDDLAQKLIDDGDATFEPSIFGKIPPRPKFKRRNEIRT